MVKDIMVIHNDEARAGTFLIAQGFDREHESVAILVKKYKSDFIEFGTLPISNRKTKGRPIKEYLLNEQQAMLLGTYFRNTDTVREFKKTLVREFWKLKIQNEALKKHKAEPEYKIVRNAGKIIRIESTNIIKEFVNYSQKQGSKHADYYYSNITKMVNGLLFIVEGRFKNLREVMTTQQLMTISSAEQIIKKGLQEGMNKGVYYKDVYKLVKSRVMQFAELHGQSEVIDKYLQIEDRE